MVKNALNHVWRNASTLVMAGWLLALAGWVVPTKYLELKIMLLSGARVLP
jgi:hypothetical protein